MTGWRAAVDFAKRRPLAILVAALAIFFYLRLALFSFNFGAIENDSGWFFGVARSLVEHNKYAGFTNPLVSDDQKIARSKIQGGRFSLQDEQGMVYFTSGVSAGPAFVFAEAFFLKLFGLELNSFKVFPLLCFLGMLLLGLRLTWQLGGELGCLLLLIWWWGLPQMHLGMAYEALAEHIAMFYLLGSILLWQKYWDRPQRPGCSSGQLVIFFSGLLFGFSYQTKLLFFQFAAAYLLHFFILCWEKRSWRWRSGSAFACGALLPTLVFEIYRYSVLTKLFGPGAYAINLSEHSTHFQTAGGSFFSFLNFNWEFIGLKALVAKNLGIESAYFLWPVLFGAGLTFWRKGPSGNRLMVLALAIISFWYVFISASGIARHFYPGIILIQIFCVGGVGELVQRAKTGARPFLYWGVLGLCLIALRPIPGVFDWDPTLDNSNINKWNEYRFITRLQGFPTNPLFSLTDQQQALKFMQEHKSEDNMFYHMVGLMAPELSGLSGKVFYPIERLAQHRQKFPARNFFLIMGPYIVANHPDRVTWLSADFADQVMAHLCLETSLRNGNYVICRAK